MTGRFSESPGLPERTGSHPITFGPGPFTRRPIPPYPNRIHYEPFDPACHRASTATAHLVPPHASVASDALTLPPIENRAGSEPHTEWHRQNVQVEWRHYSTPPALEIANRTLRERLPYPDRTVDEITDYVPPPIVESRRLVSQPITLGAEPNDWSYAWGDENNPHETEWMGYDNSNYAFFGGRDEPNETAAVANENVLESIEMESDPLIALRRLASDSQTVIRRELERRIYLEDRNQQLTRRIQTLVNNHVALERSRQQATNMLFIAERERDQLRRERDLAQSQAERFHLQIIEPGEKFCHRQAEEEAYEKGLQREAGGRERLHVLQQSEANLKAELQSAMARVKQLETERDHLDDRREQYEMERDHYRSERSRERYQNGHLQARIKALTNQLTAVQALNGQSSDNESLVNAASYAPPPAIQHLVTAHLAEASGRGRRGGNRGGTRGRVARGGVRTASITRKQPRRSCKVKKSYRT